MSRINKIIYLSILIALITLVIIFFIKRKPQSRKESPIQIYGTMLVNDQKYFTCKQNIPLYIQCIIDNPLGDKVLEVVYTKSLQPNIVDKDGNKVKATLQRINQNQGTILIKRSHIATWLIKTPLPAGVYKVTYDLTLDNFHIENHTIDRKKIFPAKLKIEEANASKKDIEYYKRRILILEGKTEEYIRQVQEALGENPEDPSLQVELIAALELTGNYEEARQKVLEIAWEIQQNQLNSEAGQKIDFPDWIPFTLERLNAKTKNKEM